MVPRKTDIAARNLRDGHWRSCGLVGIALACLMLPVTATSAEYHVDTEAENVVRFISDAPVEDFDGVTDRIDGYVTWTGDSLVPDVSNQPTSFYFEVDLASLDTGIGLRNRHMRNNYLETDDYPYATFEGALREIAPDTSNGLMIIADGTLTIHGRTQERSLECKVRPDGTGYYVTSSFSVALPDHEIEVPSLMFLKINEVIELELAFHLKPAGQEGQ